MKKIVRKRKGVGNQNKNKNKVVIINLMVNLTHTISN